PPNPALQWTGAGFPAFHGVARRRTSARASARPLSFSVRYHVGSAVSEVVPVSVRQDTGILADGERTMTATTTKAGTLYIALELGWDKWLRACATQAAQKPRYRTLPARDLARLQAEVAKAKQRFGLAVDAPVCTCFEAGRDGFWLHRALTAQGICNVV